MRARDLCEKQVTYVIEAKVELLIETADRPRVQSGRVTAAEGGVWNLDSRTATALG